MRWLLTLVVWTVVCDYRLEAILVFLLKKKKKKPPVSRREIAEAIAIHNVPNNTKW